MMISNVLESRRIDAVKDAKRDPETEQRVEPRTQCCALAKKDK
jgi:hypothetical protein